jgi:type II secretory pathway component GspD/PulD (secretin)
MLRLDELVKNKEKTMMKYLSKTGVVSLVGLLAFIVCAPHTAVAQETNEVADDVNPAVVAQEINEVADEVIPAVVEMEEEAIGAEFVTINVKNANISEVLKAYSLQTGQSIVVGPDVVSESVNVRLNNIPWTEALDVILKPYGFGYRVVGDTIIISKLENIIMVEGIEPLVSKVFTLNYLDAYDIKEVAEAQLSARGKFTILSTKGLPGWEFGGSGAGGGAATESGVRKRKERTQIQKSKTFVITDVPSIITQVDNMMEEMDMMPEQILIEATFLEINTDNGSQIGFDYITGVENVEEIAEKMSEAVGISEYRILFTDKELKKVPPTYIKDKNV